MRNKILITSLVFIIIFILSTITGCTPTLSEAELEIVGKYKLCEISVVDHAEITVETFSEYTIEFKKDKKCTVVSKIEQVQEGKKNQVVSYDSTADWKINENGEIEIITQLGCSQGVEILRYENGYVFGTNTSKAHDIVITMTVKFERIVETE